jgi:hypothetical protein
MAFALAALASTAPVQPAPGIEQIRAYAADLSVGFNGSLHVHERINYDFGLTPHHGIFRDIPEMVRYDDTYDRRYPINNVTVTATGASAETKVEHDSGLLRIRIGDPDATVTGAHIYTIDYDVGGAVDRFAQPFDHTELNWNATGDEWEVPIDRVVVRVSAPVAPTQTTCFSGTYGSSLPCSSNTVASTTATFRQRDLSPEQGVTVVLAYPPGDVRSNGPILHERPSLRRAFAATPLSLSLAGALLLVVLLGIGRVYWARGRDRRYVGQVPGLTPAPGQPVVEEPVPLFEGVPAVLEFQPPDGIRPGQCGTLLDESADTLDVTATIIDLAARGHLRIEELPHEHFWQHRDWRLTRLDPPAGESLQPYETRLLDGIFGVASAVQLSGLRNRFYRDLSVVRGQLYDTAIAAGWFRRRPDDVRAQWKGIAIGVIAAGAGLTYLLYRSTHLALVGLPVILGGVTLLAMRGMMPARTAGGAAMLSRVRGFRRYIETAEAEQLRAEERAEVFTRYLGYAIVFGLAEKWASVFEQLAASDPSIGSAVGWYAGPPGWNIGYLTGSVSQFATAAGGTFASQPSGTGSSGFGGGGFSGGGGGGGGGGSW